MLKAAIQIRNRIGILLFSVYVTLRPAGAVCDCTSPLPSRVPAENHESAVPVQSRVSSSQCAMTLRYAIKFSRFMHWLFGPPVGLGLTYNDVLVTLSRASGPSPLTPSIHSQSRVRILERCRQVPMELEAEAIISPVTPAKDVAVSIDGEAVCMPCRHVAYIDQALDDTWRVLLVVIAMAELATDAPAKRVHAAARCQAEAVRLSGCHCTHNVAASRVTATPGCKFDATW